MKYIFSILLALLIVGSATASNGGETPTTDNLNLEASFRVDEFGKILFKKSLLFRGSTCVEVETFGSGWIINYYYSNSSGTANYGDAGSEYSSSQSYVIAQTAPYNTCCFE